MSAPAVTAVTEATIARYQRRTSAVSVPGRPSARAIVSAASGPASAVRSSPRPAGASSATSRRAVSATGAAKRSRTGPARNGPTHGARWRACSGPSSVSIDAPTTRPVEKRSSCEVKVAGSPRTFSASARRVTSQARNGSTQATGSVARSRASAAGASPSSSASVTAMRLAARDEHLVDRGEAGLEAVAGGAQVQPPDAQPFGAGQPLGLLAVGVQDCSSVDSVAA